MRLSNPDAFRVQTVERRAYKARNGICIDCPEIARDGKSRCERCNRKHLKRSAKYRSRKAREERREIAEYRPLAEVVDLTRVRVLRALNRLEWASCSDIIDTLGGVDDTMRNTISQQLTRLARSGHLDRRRIPPLQGSGYGAQWEYRITQAGRANLDEIIRGGGRKYITGRRAA